ncbi:MAG: methyl-accepting chemotaxis protein [Methylocystaceae bacterium]
MDNLRLKQSQVKAMQEFAPVMVESYEDGACFFVTDRQKVVFKVSSTKFDVPGTEVGSANKPGGVADVILKAGELKILNLDRSLYGVTVKVIAAPVWSEDHTEAVGAWIIALPRMHHVEKAFGFFAPMLAEMFPEGAAMYMSDKDKLIKKQASSKFDIKDMNVGDAVKEGGAVHEVIRTGKQIIKDVPPAVYGVPVMLACSPLFDDNTNQVIGTFGMALPRAMTNELKGMAQNLSSSMQQIAAAMEEMAAATSEVAEHQGNLNEEIYKIAGLSEEINIILNFIKQIAEETKMLGLNAAIEAARAGDAGRGFGVVAEEIRNLSDKSKETVVQIRNLIEKIQGSIKDTQHRSDATLKVTEQQAAASEEINASIEEISSMAEQLQAMAANL